MVLVSADWKLDIFCGCESHGQLYKNLFSHLKGDKWGYT